jgi:hypothetical protein
MTDLSIFVYFLHPSNTQVLQTIQSNLLASECGSTQGGAYHLPHNPKSNLEVYKQLQVVVGIQVINLAE